MGHIREPSPVLLLLAAFSRDPRALAWARRTATAAWGPVALTSDVFDFVETDYYAPTMGRELKKTFLAFEQTVDAAALAALKEQTNSWEDECCRWYAAPDTRRPLAPSKPIGAGGNRAPAAPVEGPQDGLPGAAVTRPLNLDPGYLTEAKLVLASTKDHAHRIYLGRGIYAEVTLHYQNGRWQSHDWTYPDFQRPDYHLFFSQCRDFFRRRGTESDSP